AFFGDLLGHVYAVNASTGEKLWRQRADDHPNTTITGTPSLHEGVLYTPVSSLEVNLGLDPYYECCTFRGSVAAYDAATGELLWQTFTIDELAVVQYQNRAETNMWGPSGAVIWNSPAIDAKRNQLYVATGENMSSPATLTSDAIFAMALDDGAVNWVFQATANDVWNTACDTENDHSCPPEGGPDFDFGAATMLLTASDGRELVIGGQKSGIVHAVNPDDGSVVWQTRVGRGGIQGGVHFGMAAAGDRLFVPMSDMADGREYDTPDRPGMHALDIRTGEILWSSLNPDACKGRDFCHPGVSQAVTAANGVVYAGAMDGVLRAHDVETGAVLWELDTTQEFTTITGETTHGGSFGGAAGPIIHQGELALSSGYGIYNHMAGNLLLVLSASEPTSP
ncbi:MAG: PQQ-binding-like beta-propeller repeat protein, partial [Gammaproteobacteria bacterium]|nr:PQQ-binding-like beta-propeller repeat protein [Gammaproteobacteria bacterium]